MDKVDVSEAIFFTSKHAVADGDRLQSGHADMIAGLMLHDMRIFPEMAPDAGLNPDMGDQSVRCLQSCLLVHLGVVCCKSMSWV